MPDLKQLLRPESIAVIGASIHPDRAGHIVMRNLLEGGFNGPIMPVHPSYKSVCGILAYKEISELPITPDFAILCTEAKKNVSILEELGEKGVRCAIILSSDMNLYCNGIGEPLPYEAKRIAAKYNMRILGPNSLGIILPWINLNASFSPINANKGNIAFISQSAAVCTTILDWANEKNIGFSAFVSLGDGLDIDFSELLDTLCTDSKTEAILLYIDSIKDARQFMSAARAAARNRRILVVKSGRSVAGSKAAQLHTNGQLSLDAVYDSAIRRAGMLRVSNTHELFAAVETLAHPIPFRGHRLAIVTNGGGPAIMAVDSLMQQGGKLADFSETLIQKLNKTLPENWSHANPIDIGGDANDTRYCDAVNALLDSDDCDAILIMHSPSAVSNATKTSEKLISLIQNHKRKAKFTILTNWSGETSSKEARLLFTQAGIPTYRTPESAVSAFLHLVEYHRNQGLLIETPVSSGHISKHDAQMAREWLENCVTHNLTELDTHETQALYSCYGFKTLDTWITEDPVETGYVADKIGYPVAVKLRSPDIPHKSDVHGVVLNLNTNEEVITAAQSILDRVSLSYPSARISGLSVQKMAARAGSQELRIKVCQDPVFGPVILLGEGGSEWDLNNNAAVALPPLNMALAENLIKHAIKENIIHNRNSPNKMSLFDLSAFLVRLSQMILDCPEIVELDIHPLLVSGMDLTIIDSSMKVQHFNGDIHKRLAIRPYPNELEEFAQLKDGSSVLLRPILPEDEPKHASFISQVSHDDLYKRFFSEVGEFNHEALANFTQIDYDREMAFVATKQVDGEEIIIAVVRALSDPNHTNTEFAVLVRSDLKGLGLGKILMKKIIRYCQSIGIKVMTGMTMPANHGMIGLAQHLGFSVDIQMSDGVVDMFLEL
ncbi:bifunctional acetate--CoA ligase family protein/GNAT family N-acetyltransferase [Aliivibrio fischeri]|uniref:bifunctional acetate--CoA ligase family protein/GNAT family N-acetyltransferase n=1 Tax=Aliivibrio fischeri TaxID=668 RepID=UPI00080E1870|nr:bifunctional acetate--CoA ligase family protein/GNAT family N-acetyltransferase [Aliivibrio fischeri]MUK43546.1 GNAT family N-acetyltransferase [Aliivibrio fischeri]OCH05062.1 protein acetyltransferase [Aliivibrio fischeri]OCH10529.1 protein acetyltransferase [Aliivibrio fischeri]